jgi:hypothetical protein
MRRGWLPWIAGSAFALAWVLPVHKDGVTLPKGLPGWEAFRVAAAPVWPYKDVTYETKWGAALAALSAGTNLVMLGSLWAWWRLPSGRRVAAVAALAAFVVNAQWLFLNTEWVDLRAGYYLWWLSFLAAGLSLRGAGTRRDQG